jgi:hypothetical protein
MLSLVIQMRKVHLQTRDFVSVRSRESRQRVCGVGLLSLNGQLASPTQHRDKSRRVAAKCLWNRKHVDQVNQGAVVNGLEDGRISELFKRLTDARQ